LFGKVKLKMKFNHYWYWWSRANKRYRRTG